MITLKAFCPNFFFFFCSSAKNFSKKCGATALQEKKTQIIYIFSKSIHIRMENVLQCG